MANYTSLQDAIDAGTTNMTTLRSSANDDGTDTYATGIDWFKFNNVVASNLYASGNSCFGFGTIAEQLKVNRRDTKVYYEYSETGSIGNTRFYKFRWNGYSRYNYTSSSYAQNYDIFLFDTGQIYLNFYQVPSSSADGTNALVCGSETVTYSVTSGTPCEYTFTPSNENGTGWSVEAGKPVLVKNYKTNGSAEYSITVNETVTTSEVSWSADTPTGTTATVSRSLDNGSTWAELTNGGVLIPTGEYNNQTVKIKIALATTDTNATPTVSNLHVEINTSEDANKIVLEMVGTERFENAAGNITVAYDGGGTLIGEGGAVLAFTQTFTPTGLIPKPNQNEEEHISISATTTGILMKINYTNNSSAQEHIKIANIIATGTLTNIQDV